MKRRFIIAAEGLTTEGQRKLMELLRDRSLGWWHHIDNLWLAYTTRQDPKVSELRDQIAKLRPTGNPILVLEVPKHVSWAGMKPSTTPGMFEWIEKNWTPD